MQINDRYEFPDELDLDVGEGKYLSENADRSVRNLYKLHSVLVHSGGVHGGHYYAFIQPDGKQWLKFDDERVSIGSTSLAAFWHDAPLQAAPGVAPCTRQSCWNGC
jgi:ubiquitin carboxyl-terminal hydrolase 7